MYYELQSKIDGLLGEFQVKQGMNDNEQFYEFKIYSYEILGGATEVDGGWAFMLLICGCRTCDVEVSIYKAFYPPEEPPF